MHALVLLLLAMFILGISYLIKFLFKIAKGFFNQSININYSKRHKNFNLRKLLFDSRKCKNILKEFSPSNKEEKVDISIIMMSLSERQQYRAEQRVKVHSLLNRYSNDSIIN